MSFSRRDSLEFAIRCHAPTFSHQEIVKAADAYYNYIIQDSKTTAKPDKSSNAGAAPLQEFLEKLSDRAAEFGKQSESAVHQAIGTAGIKVGDKVSWNGSANDWEVMALLETQNVAWIKSATSCDYRTTPITHLRKRQ